MSYIRIPLEWRLSTAKHATTPLDCGVAAALITLTPQLFSQTPSSQAESQDGPPFLSFPTSLPSAACDVIKGSARQHKWGTAYCRPEEDTDWSAADPVLGGPEASESPLENWLKAGGISRTIVRSFSTSRSLRSDDLWKPTAPSFMVLWSLWRFECLARACVRACARASARECAWWERVVVCQHFSVQWARVRAAVSVRLQSAHIRTYRVQTMHRVRVKG